MTAPIEVPEDIVERVRTLCLALPEVTVRVDGSRTRTRSTAHSFDIRRRSFCLLVAWEDSTSWHAFDRRLSRQPARFQIEAKYQAPIVGRSRNDRVRLTIPVEPRTAKFDPPGPGACRQHQLT